MKKRFLAATAALLISLSVGIPAAHASYGDDIEYGQIYDIDEDYDNYNSGQGEILDSEYDYSGYGNSETNINPYQEENVLGNNNSYNQYQRTSEPNTVKAFIICLGIGLLIGFIVTLSMKSSMKSVRQQTGAADYKNPNGIKLRERRDDFLYNRIEKTPIAQPRQQGTPPQGNRPNQPPKP